MNKSGWTRKALNDKEKYDKQIDKASDIVIIVVKVVVCILIFIASWSCTSRIRKEGLKKWLSPVWNGEPTANPQAPTEAGE